MRVVRRLTAAEVSSDLLVEIRRLLVRAFTGGFSDDDWEHALGGWHVVATDDGVVAAHAAVVRRVLEVGEQALGVGYVEGVATAPERRARRTRLRGHG